MPMSSTGSLRKTDRGSIAEAFSTDRVATILAAVLLTTVIVSFRPFQPGGAEPFSMLGALALFSIMAFARPRVISVFFSPCWMLLIAFFTLSVLNAADPSAAARAAFFTAMGIVTIVAVLAVPRDADSFSTVIAFAGITVVVVSVTASVCLTRNGSTYQKRAGPER